eukprot:6211049-Pleurochrysis_carterae.AAC.8
MTCRLLSCAAGRLYRSKAVYEELIEKGSKVRAWVQWQPFRSSLPALAVTAKAGSARVLYMLLACPWPRLLTLTVNHLHCNLVFTIEIMHHRCGLGGAPAVAPARAPDRGQCPLSAEMEKACWRARQVTITTATNTITFLMDDTTMDEHFQASLTLQRP